QITSPPPPAAPRSPVIGSPSFQPPISAAVKSLGNVAETPPAPITPPPVPVEPPIEIVPPEPTVTVPPVVPPPLLCPALLPPLPRPARRPPLRTPPPLGAPSPEPQPNASANAVPSSNSLRVFTQRSARPMTPVWQRSAPQSST